jgi:hypothetical protein
MTSHLMFIWGVARSHLLVGSDCQRFTSGEAAKGEDPPHHRMLSAQNIPTTQIIRSIVQQGALSCMPPLVLSSIAGVGRRHQRATASTEQLHATRPACESNPPSKLYLGGMRYPRDSNWALYACRLMTLARHHLPRLACLLKPTQRCYRCDNRICILQSN